MVQSTVQRESQAVQSTDPLNLIDVDHVQFYVGNAKQAAFFYAHCFGFQIEQVSDLTTGSRAAASYLLTQGNIRLLLTSGLSAEHPASQEVARFGDGIKDVAFNVADAEKAYEQALANGAESAYEPWVATDAVGTVVRAGIKTFGRVVHSLVSRQGAYALEHLKQEGRFAPGFTRVPISKSTPTTGCIPAACFMSIIAWAMWNKER